jgi:DNA-binding SARP family transcriptional activator
MPRSRKVRAALAFLALSPGALPRPRLCDLLWDVPNDPRGELRWCLSKLRGLLDDPDRQRVVTRDDLVALDLSDCRVDAVEVERAVNRGVDRTELTELARLCELAGGDLLDGVELDGSPEFHGWLAAQRNRYRAMRVTMLHALATRTPDTSETFRWLDTWLQLAPFDRRAHAVMLEALVRSGRHHDAEAHVAATRRAFDKEGLDSQPLADALRGARAAPGPRLDAASAAAIPHAGGRRRASVAVMPFVDRLPSADSRVADGVTEDIIMQLAKLRVLFVIARGTVFALGERGIGPHEAGRMLGVDYVVNG